jgi:hypothetical protein
MNSLHIEGLPNKLPFPAQGAITLFQVDAPSETEIPADPTVEQSGSSNPRMYSGADDIALNVARRDASFCSPPSCLFIERKSAKMVHSVPSSPRKKEKKTLTPPSPHNIETAIGFPSWDGLGVQSYHHPI